MIKLHPLLTSLFSIFFTSLATHAIAQDLPTDINPDSMARLPYVKRADLSLEDQAIYDKMPAQLPSGELAGPLAWAGYDMGVAKALFDLHNAAVATEELNDYERELAILVACRATDYSLEWNGHAASAIRSGVPERIINVIKYNQSLQGVPEKDAAIIHFGRQLLNDRKVDSATFAKAEELFGAKGIMDLTSIMITYVASGYYAIAVDERMGNGTDLE